MNQRNHMRALRFHAWGQPPRLEIVPIPTAGQEESLIRVRAATVSHLDVTIAAGDFAVRPELPYTGGVEAAGEIVASTAFARGSAVTVRGGGIGSVLQGTWAEYVLVPDELITPVPDGLSFDLAAAAFDPLSTASVALSEVARLGEWGTGPASAEVVIVAGATGAVGSLVCRLAVRAGARVLGTIRQSSDVGRLPDGVEPVELFDPARLAELAAQRPASLLIDTVGGSGLGQRMSWVAVGGRAAVVGYTGGRTVAFDLPNWLFQDVAVLPVNLIRRAADGDAAFRALHPLLRDGKLLLPVAAASLDDAVSAYTEFAAGRGRERLVLRT